MKRTISDIENEIVDVQNRIDALHKELREQKDKLHSLKEEKFEVANNVNKGDIIQDTNGVKYYYQGIPTEWENCFKNNVQRQVRSYRLLTPEILTAAGWIKWHENDAVVNFEKEVDDVCFNLDFRKRIKKIDIQVDNCIKARLNNVTVGEFNTLLDIVKLSKFKIK